MKKDLQNLSEGLKALTRFTHTELNFIDVVKVSAKLSVLGHLNINSETLRSMGIMELKTLSRILALGMLRVDREIQRRGKRM